jgi:hypothetical protein
LGDVPRWIANGRHGFARERSPGANILALLFRASTLGTLAEQLPMTGDNPLAPWRRGKEFDDAVFKAIAKIPLKWLQPGVRMTTPASEFEAFIQQVRDEIKKQ